MPVVIDANTTTNQSSYLNWLQTLQSQWENEDANKIAEFCRLERNDLNGVFALSKKLKGILAQALRACKFDDPTDVEQSNARAYAQYTFFRTQSDGKDYINPINIALDNAQRGNLSKSEYGKKVLRYADASLAFTKCSLYKKFIEKLEEAEQKSFIDLHEEILSILKRINPSAAELSLTTAILNTIPKVQSGVLEIRTKFDALLNLPTLPPVSNDRISPRANQNAELQQRDINTLAALNLEVPRSSKRKLNISQNADNKMDQIELPTVVNSDSMPIISRLKLWLLGPDQIEEFLSSELNASVNKTRLRLWLLGPNQIEVEEFLSSELNASGNKRSIYDLLDKLAIMQERAFQICDLWKQPVSGDEAALKYAKQVFTNVQNSTIEPATIASDHEMRATLSQSSYGKMVLKYVDANIAFNKCKLYCEFIERLKSQNKGVLLGIVGSLFVLIASVWFTVESFLLLRVLAVAPPISIFANLARYPHLAILSIPLLPLLIPLAIIIKVAQLVFPVFALSGLVAGVFAFGYAIINFARVLSGALIDKRTPLIETIQKIDPELVNEQNNTSLKSKILNTIHNIKDNVFKMQDDFAALPQEENAMGLQSSRENTLTALCLEKSKAPRLANIARGSDSDDDRLDQEIAAPTSRPSHGLYHI